VLGGLLIQLYTGRLALPPVSGSHADLVGVKAVGDDFHAILGGATAALALTVVDILYNTGAFLGTPETLPTVGLALALSLLQ